MPQTNVITVSEMVLLSLVWSACNTAWRGVIIDGLSEGVAVTLPGATKYARSLVVGALLLGVVYAVVLLSASFNLGRFKVFELAG